jgi:single-stranded DNA-binding protein
MAVLGVLEFTQIGYLADNPTFRENADGSKVANFRVITNVVWKDKTSQEEKQRVEGFPYEVWGQAAENVRTLLKKGSHVYVKAEPYNHKFEGDNGTQYSVRFSVREWRLLDRAEKGQPTDTGGKVPESEEPAF